MFWAWRTRIYPLLCFENHQQSKLQGYSEKDQIFSSSCKLLGSSVICRYFALEACLNWEIRCKCWWWFIRCAGSCIPSQKYLGVKLWTKIVTDHHWNRHRFSMHIWKNTFSLEKVLLGNASKINPIGLQNSGNSSHTGIHTFWTHKRAANTLSNRLKVENRNFPLKSLKIRQNFSRKRREIDPSRLTPISDSKSSSKYLRTSNFYRNHCKNPPTKRETLVLRLVHETLFCKDLTRMPKTAKNRLLRLWLSDPFGHN